MSYFFNWVVSLLARLVEFLLVDTMPLFGGIFSLGSFLITVFLLRLAFKYLLFTAGSRGSTGGDS